MLVGLVADLLANDQISQRVVVPVRHRDSDAHAGLADLKFGGSGIDDAKLLMIRGALTGDAENLPVDDTIGRFRHLAVGIRRIASF